MSDQLLNLHTQGTGKHALVDSFDTSKLIVVHRKFINRVVGQKSSEILVREAVDIAFRSSSPSQRDT